MTGAGVLEATRAERFLADRLRDPERPLAALVGPNVYRAPAPDVLEAAPLEGVAVTFQYLAGPPDTVVVGTGPDTRALVRLDFIVKAVGPREGPDLAPVADAIDLALHGAQGALDGLAITCTRTSTVNYPELAAGRLFEHLGGTYRLELA